MHVDVHDTEFNTNYTHVEGHGTEININERYVKGNETEIHASERHKNDIDTGDMHIWEGLSIDNISQVTPKRTQMNEDIEVGSTVRRRGASMSRRDSSVTRKFFSFITPSKGEQTNKSSRRNNRNATRTTKKDAI